MMRRKQLQVPAAAWLAIWWVLGLQGAQSAPNAEEVETMCAQGEVSLARAPLFRCLLEAL